MPDFAQMSFEEMLNPDGFDCACGRKHSCALRQFSVAERDVWLLLQPLMKKLGWPTIFCNSLEVAENGEITGIKMRVEKSKLTTVRALQSIGFDTIASGDSYNDLDMILASKAGCLFRSTEQIKKDYPQLGAFEEYDDLLEAIKKAMV